MRLPFIKNVWGAVVAGLLCARGAQALISADRLCECLVSRVQSCSGPVLSYVTLDENLDSDKGGHRASDCDAVRPRSQQKAYPRCFSLVC